jgi:hypothetical protein
MIERGKLIKSLRALHRYLGIFFSPAILFFALSGGLQVLNLHKPDKNTGYTPAAWIQEMAQVHKSQSLSLPKERTKPAQSDPVSGDPPAAKNAARPHKSKLPLQCFFLVMSTGLIATTLLGIYMAFCFRGKRWLTWAMLIVGTLLPIGMMIF